MTSARAHPACSCAGSTASHKQSSTWVAGAEKNAECTPLPSHVVPSGDNVPGHMRIALGLLRGDLWRRHGVYRCHSLGLSTIFVQVPCDSLWPPTCAGRGHEDLDANRQ